MNKKTTLSNFELEIMHIFWELGTLTAPDIHKLVQQKREVSYSTVKTIIDRLETKRAVKRVESEGRTICYDAILEKQKTRLPLIKEFIDRVFMGNSKPLAAHLLAESELSESDIEYLEVLLQQRKTELKK
jgi:BlaI family penicillinase repressor